MKFKSAAFVCAAFLLPLLSGCISLPTGEKSIQLPPAQPVENTQLNNIFSADADTHAPDSGNLLLRDGQRSLKERLYLIDMAEQSIDIQYFLWNDDRSGRLLIQKIVTAADRGVDVRILIDGFSIDDHIGTLATINQHPNIQVHVYNPFVARTGFGRVLNLLFDFDRLNHRMHNKSLTVDHTATITGGRNIGDPYFFLDKTLNFNDVDVFSTGSVVAQVSDSFLEYWNHSDSIPIERLKIAQSYKDHYTKDMHNLRAENFSTLLDTPLLNDTDAIREHFIALNETLTWAPTRFIADDPDYRPKKEDDMPKAVAMAIGELILNSQDEVLIESAYFVVNELGINAIKQIKDAGVRIQVLTNSMASNNLLPNHASYAMVRKNIIESGIELYELKPSDSACMDYDLNDAICKDKNNVALHAKTAVFDNRTVYVGSLNFNLRSAYLNTESALIIESVEMADQLKKQIKKHLNLYSSWKPTLLGDELLWVTFSNGQTRQTRTEPHTTALQRMEVDLLTQFSATAFF